MDTALSGGTLISFASPIPIVVLMDFKDLNYLRILLIFSAQ